MDYINRRQTIVPLLAASMALAGPLPAAVIDFDTATPVVGATEPYVEDGFQVTAPGGAPNHYDIGTCAQLPAACGAFQITFDNYGGLWNSAVRLGPVGGGTFDLVAFDVYSAETTGYYLLPPFGSFTEPCASRCQVRSSGGGIADLVAGHMAFSAPEWRQIDWIEFLVPSESISNDITTVRVDNIEVTPSPVPAPPALALLATGLVALWVRASRLP